MSMINTQVPLGTTGTIIANTSQHEFEIGAKVTLRRYDGDGDAVFASGDEEWYLNVEDINLDLVAPRPVRALPHQTQRDYAKKARSPKCLDKAHNAILWNAYLGKEVDVFDFRQAATAALSLAATRAGQSMARRDWTREARALIHWADAILENHLDGLPVYAEGDRSRAVESAKAGLAGAIAEVDRLTAALQERDTEILRLQSVAHDAVRAARRADDDLAIVADNKARLYKVSEFARSLLDEVGRAKVEGFIEGLDA